MPRISSSISIQKHNKSKFYIFYDFEMSNKRNFGFCKVMDEKSNVVDIFTNKNGKLTTSCIIYNLIKISFKDFSSPLKI
jgi:hypothetical protein